MNEHRIGLLALFLLALCASCRGTHASEEGGSAPAAEPAVRSLVRGYHSGLRKTGVRVARTAEQWRVLWREHASYLVPEPELPEVDWSRDMVVGVFLGERPSGGFSVEVRDVVAKDGRLLVQAVETKPAEDRVVPMVVTHPYHFVRAPRAEGEAQLELR